MQFYDIILLYSEQNLYISLIDTNNMFIVKNYVHSAFISYARTNEKKSYQFTDGGYSQYI